MSKSDLWNNRDKCLVDVLVVARFLYKIGQPWFKGDSGDSIYNTLEKRLAKTHPESYILYQTYDDDTSPKDVFDKWGIPFPKLPKYSKVPDSVNCISDEFFDEHFSDSIKPYDNVDDVWKWFVSLGYPELIASLKINGVNSKTLYTEGNYVYTGSRAKKGKGHDYSFNASRIIPLTVPLSGNHVVYAEILTDKTYLPELKAKTDKGDSPRASALSMLLDHNEIYDARDYSRLTYRAFHATGISSNKLEIFNTLKHLGFNTVPFKVLSKITDEETFKEAIHSLVKDFYESSHKANLLADGVVLETLDTNAGGRIALKLDGFGHVSYTGICRKIVLEQKKVNAGCHIIIDPLTIEEGVTVKEIDGIDPATVINLGININKPVKFYLMGDMKWSV